MNEQKKLTIVLPNEERVGKDIQTLGEIGETLRNPIDPAHTSVIRRKGGDVDDVVITGDMFRMERMGDDNVWLAIYRGDKRVAFNLSARKSKIEISLNEDDLGCTDDQ